MGRRGDASCQRHTIGRKPDRVHHWHGGQSTWLLTCIDVRERCPLAHRVADDLRASGRVHLDPGDLGHGGDGWADLGERVCCLAR